MGREWAYDEDDYRLPDGMTRVGYDADTEVYTYRDENGRLWQGAPGNRYGRLKPVGGLSRRRTEPKTLPNNAETSRPVMTEFPASMTTTNAEHDSNSNDTFTERIVAPIQALRRSLTQKIRPIISKPETKDDEPETVDSWSRSTLRRTMSLGRSYSKRSAPPPPPPPTYRQSQRDFILNGADPGKKPPKGMEVNVEESEKGA